MHPVWNRSRRPARVLVGLALAGSLVACSGGADRPGGSAPAATPGAGSSATTPGADPSASSSPSASGSPSAAGSPSGSASPGAASAGGTAAGSPSATAPPSRAPDPVVKSYRRVLRDGKRPTSTVSAAPAPFDGTVRYGDGVRLTVTAVRQATVTGQGAGEFTGEPTTEVRLLMTNRADRAVSLDQVVVTALYGPDDRSARPVYDGGSSDFSGSLRPGGRAKAVYGFAIPRRYLGQVTMVVDFDGRHTVATFRGDPRAAG